MPTGEGGDASSPALAHAADSDDYLLRGDRIPDFSLPAADGRWFLFYEYATGEPTLVVGCPPSLDGSDVLLPQLAELARRHGSRALVLCDQAGGGRVDDRWCIALVDEGARVRRSLFGEHCRADRAVAVVTDRNLRVLDGCIEDTSTLNGTGFMPLLARTVEEALRGLESDQPVPAPVLTVPRVLPESLCAELIAGFDAWSPVESPLPVGDGSALRVDARYKARRDVLIGDAELEEELVASIARRVLPELHKAFCFRAERFERPKLVCYDAAQAGHFAAHRDNTAPDTRHRRFALTLNLNTGEYRGGELEFPEYDVDYGYAPPVGAAIAFACSHAHAVRPVTAGRRYAIVSFITEAAARTPD